MPDSANPWIAAHQTPLSMRFSRQRSWSGLPLPFPGDLPNAGIEPRSPALQADSLPTELQGKPIFWLGCLFFWYWVVWAACIFWKLILCQLFHLLLFFPILRVVFPLAYSLLCCAKTFMFNLIPLAYFHFYFHYSRQWVIENLAVILSSSVLTMFSSKSFIVSGLSFRSLIHFEFIFVYGVRKCSNFILLHVTVQFPQHHLLKRLSLPHCIFLPPLSKIRYP